MKIDIMTLFPEAVGGMLHSSILGRAEQKGILDINCIQIRQHSDTLHSPTKLLYEKILDRKFRYEENKLLEINFENARCTYDTNMNRYITKKRSQGKVDMVVALINAVHLLQQDVFLENDDFFVQVIE